MLADSVGAATEALGGLVQVLGFVLELVNVLAALGYGFEVFLHDVDGVVDLLWRRAMLAIVLCGEWGKQMGACNEAGSSVSSSGFVVMGCQ